MALKVQSLAPSLAAWPVQRSQIIGVIAGLITVDLTIDAPAEDSTLVIITIIMAIIATGHIMGPHTADIATAVLGITLPLVDMADSALVAEDLSTDRRHSKTSLI